MSQNSPLRLENVVKRYGDETALNGVNLAMDRGTSR